MRLSIVSSAYVIEENFLDGFIEMKKDGYDATDLQILSDMKNKYHTMNIKEFEKAMKKIKKDADEAGIEIHQLHGAWPTYEFDEGNDENAHIAFEREIYGAYLLGCPNVVIHPCMPFGWGEDKNPEESFNATVKRCQDLMPICEKYHINLCLENMPMTALSTSKVKAIKAIVDKVNNKYMKICLDTGHVNVYPDEDIYQAVITAGDKLEVIHFHDNKYNIDAHLLPYFGTLDINNFIKGLKDIKYKGTLSLETCAPEKLPEEIYKDARKLVSKMAKYIADQIDVH